MNNKSQIRIAGEVITLINNIFITLSVVGFIISLFFTKTIFEKFIFNNYYGMSENFSLVKEYDFISNILGLINNHKGIIISMALVLVALIWVFRNLVITSRSKILSVIAIIFNVVSILGLVGYSLILYDNIKFKNNSDYDEVIKSSFSSNIIIGATVILAIAVSIPSLSLFFKSDFQDDSIKTNNIEHSEVTNNQIISVDIKNDFEFKKTKFQGLANKENGIFRYNKALIDTLHNYNLNSIDNAKTVYELSDALLNDMYRSLKNDLSEEDFNNLKTSQKNWVQDKENYEKNSNDSNLLKYQKLVNKTLDKCNEWNEIYY